MKILYKKLIKIFFEIFYGKIQLATKNKLDFKNFKIIKLKCFNKTFKLYKINQGKIFTDCNTNVAYITKNNLITNFSYQQNGNKISSIKYNSVLQFGTPKIRKNIRGSVFSLIQGASGQNYFHWLFDLLPKIEVLNNQKKLKKIEYFLVPNMGRNIIETLKVYGIRENQLIDSQKYKHVKADEIFFLENIYLRNGLFQKQFGNMPKNITRTIRKKLLKYKGKKFSFKKIFIDRSDSKFTHYQLYNNNEIIKKLKLYKFGIFKLSKLNIFDQISLFNSAKLVVGLHGAGFANVMFCKKNTKIYEILKKSDKEMNLTKTICKHIGLKYKKILINKFSDYKSHRQLLLDNNFFKIIK